MGLGLRLGGKGREKAEASHLRWGFLFLNKTHFFKKMSCKMLLGGHLMAAAGPAALPGAGMGVQGCWAGGVWGRGVEKASSCLAAPGQRPPLGAAVVCVPGAGLGPRRRRP